MNKIYRIVFNAATGRWVVASELATGRKKAGSAGRLRLVAAATFAMTASGLACAGSLDGGSATATDAVSYGGLSTATGFASTAVGTQSHATNVDATAIGSHTTASGINSVALGNQIEAAGSGSIAIGGNGTDTIAVDAASSTGIAIGQSAMVSNSVSGIALGRGATVSGASKGIALGDAASATAANSVALGTGSTTTADLTQAGYNPGSAALSGTASTANGEVSIGSSTKERRLTNLAAGSAATDAVNVSQLQAEDATVDKQGADTAALLGGGATYNAATGAITAPSYTLANANTIGGNTGAAADVGNGFAKVDAALGALNTTANKGFNVSADAGATSQNIAPGGTVKFAAGTNATVSRSADTITYGIVANPTFTGMVTANGGLTVGAGKTIDMGANKVTNVAAGAAATDAVNKSQLDAVAATAGSAMTFTGNDATAGVVNRTLGQTLAIKGAASTTGTYSGSNVKTVTDPVTGAINVQMADAPKFGAVTVNDSGSGKITGVTDGLVASGSKEAVNGGQLYTTNQQVLQQGTDTAARLGGGAAYNAATGAITAPSYTLANANTIGGTSGAAADVGNGFAKVDGALGALNTTLTNITNGGGIKYFHTNSTLADSSATGANAIAVGGGAVASNASGIAIGTNAKTNGGQAAIAIGEGASAQGGLAVGGSNSVALGAGANADATTGNWGRNTALGAAANANSTNGTAVGYGAVATGVSATAVGYTATATAAQAVALGNAANASAANSVALGTGSTTTADLTQAGYNPGSAALSGTASTANGEVSIGSSTKERRLTNLAAGSAATDAVNVSQLQAEDATVDKQGADTAALLGGGATYNATTGAITAPSYTLANANTIGGNTGAAADVGNGFAKVDAALGALNTTANKGFNISADAGATSQNIAPGGTVKFAAGTNATVSRTADSITYGVVANPTFTGMVTANGGLTVGAGKTIDMGANKVTNVAAGTVATDAVNKSQLDAVAATAGSAMSFTGNDATAGVVNRTLGQTLAIKGTASTAGTYSGSNVKTVTDPVTGAINVQMADAPKFGGVIVNDSGSGKITGVTDGLVASGSKEAVNGGQLYTTNQQVLQQGTTTAAALGGTSTYNAATGAVSAPSYTLANANTIGGNTGAATDVGTGFTKVDSALGGLDTRVTQNTTAISTMGDQLSSGTIGLVQQAAAGANLTVGKDTDGAAVDFADMNGAARKLINVADGTVAAGSKDAVNGGQLHGVSQSVADAMGGGSTVNADGSISAPSYTVTNADGTTSTVNTVGDAVTNLDDRVNDNTTAISTIGDQLSSGTIGLVQQAAAGANLTVGKDTDGAAVDFADMNGAARKLINVADGTVASGSKDAVNGGQLYGVSQSVADAMGGGSTVNADGSISAPTYTLTNADGTTSTVNNVGDAVSNLDGRVTNVEGSVSTITNQLNNGEIGLVQYDAAAQSVTVAKGQAGTTVDFRNNAGVSRRLKGVAAGADDEDAVNVAQLKSSLGGTASYDAMTGAYVGPTYSVTNADGSTSQVNGVGGAITNLDSRVYNNTTQIQNISSQINSGTIGLVQQAAPGANLTVGKDTDGAAIDVAGTAGARKLVNVADGTVAAGSKEAVNGGQLHDVSQSMATALGGGSTVNADGTISAPSYSVTNADGSTSQVNGVEGAVSNLDNRVYQNTTAIAGNTSAINNLTTQISNGEVGLVKQDATTRQITVAKDTDGTSVNMAGTAGDRVVTGVAAAKADNDAVNLGQLKQAGVVGANGEAKSVMTYDDAGKTSATMGGEGATTAVTIHNVADGVAEHDAVNVSQLNQRLDRNTTEVLVQANSYTDQKIGDVWTGMDKLANELSRQDGRISQQGAMSMAEAQMASGAAAAAVGNPNGAWSVGLGSEQGHGAISAGYAKPVGKASQISFGAAFSGSDHSIGVGFAHKL